MSGVQPVAVYAMRIPPGDIMVPAVPEFAAMFRVTMAAIDPSAEPELEDTEDKRTPRATLKLVRVSDDQFEDDSDDEDYLDGEDDDEDEDSEDEANGGPSEKKSRKQKLLEALAADEEDEDEDMEDDDEDSDEDDEDADDVDVADVIKQLIKKGKGKGKALEGEEDEDDEDDEDDESDEALELDEVVICTLDPEKHYQQPLDFVVGEGEKVFFKVSGTHEVHLTGNYVMPIDDGQASLYDEDEMEDEYDLSPDEDELDALEDEDEESDELDDLADPRITEVASDEEAVPKLVAKGKNKRPAEDSDAEDDLDALVAKSIKKEEAVNGEPKKLSKAEKKAAKKLKKNDGEAAAAATPDKKADSAVNGLEKKTVQFAKNLEQGPTPSATPPVKKEEAKKEDTKKSAANNVSLGIRDVKGVTVDDRKIGSGPGAKKNSRVEMRYIGKLEGGKVFDSNKSGKPFGFKLGTGEVIKGWDIGLEGISAGGERRITIPAHLAYGNKALPGIPKNSKLIFDVKCLSVK